MIQMPDKDVLAYRMSQCTEPIIEQDLVLQVKLFPYITRELAGQTFEDITGVVVRVTLAVADYIEERVRPEQRPAMARDLQAVRQPLIAAALETAQNPALARALDEYFTEERRVAENYK